MARALERLNASRTQSRGTRELLREARARLVRIPSSREEDVSRDGSDPTTDGDPMDAT